MHWMHLPFYTVHIVNLEMFLLIITGHSLAGAFLKHWGTVLLFNPHLIVTF